MLWWKKMAAPVFRPQGDFFGFPRSLLLKNRHTCAYLHPNIRIFCYDMKGRTGAKLFKRIEAIGRAYFISLVKYWVRSLKYIWAPVQSCTHWLKLHKCPPPLHLVSYTRALLVSQDRRHLYVTPYYIDHCVGLGERSLLVIWGPAPQGTLSNPSKAGVVITHHLYAD